MQIPYRRLVMASRSLYLYQPLGGKTTSWRDFLCNPVRCTAILLIIALSLTSIGFLLIERPWGESTLAPNIFLPTHEPESEPPEPPGPELIDATVYHPFIAPFPEKSIVDQTVRPIKAHSTLSDECLDKWVSTGLWQDPCRRRMVQDAVIDLVYVWVNGSCVAALDFAFAISDVTLRDAQHQKARQALLTATKYKTKEARFREHDELRYSFRSARNATASWPNSTWHLITADVPEPAMENAVPDHTRRLGLVPQWLDIECAFYGCPDGQPPIRLQHGMLFLARGASTELRRYFRFSTFPPDGQAWCRLDGYRCDQLVRENSAKFQQVLVRGCSCDSSVAKYNIHLAMPLRHSFRISIPTRYPRICEFPYPRLLRNNNANSVSP
jgi:hypothetical protein